METCSTRSRIASNHEASTDSCEKSVYQILVSHQLQEQWQSRDMMAFLRYWPDRFIVEFKLDIPKLALCIDRLPVNRYGHFREGHNGFGLVGEVAINDRYLNGAREVWEVLGTLLHELLHAWQATHGTPSKKCHHNTQFRQKASEFGLIVDEDGVTSFAANSSFKELLRDSGIKVPEGEIHKTRAKSRGTSKQRKYSCGCTNIRVAAKEFRGLCLLCKREFVADDTVGRAQKSTGTSQRRSSLRSSTFPSPTFQKTCDVRRNGGSESAPQFSPDAVHHVLCDACSSMEE